MLFATAIVLLSLTSLFDFGNTASFALSQIFDIGVIAALRFGFLQAILSTLVALALGIVLGRAYSRRQHLLRMRWLMLIFSTSFLLPVIVAVFGLIAVHGGGGWVHKLAGYLGIRVDNYIYGLSGIIIAHVFFNAPLAARLISASLQAIPPQHWRMAAQWGLAEGSAWTLFRIVEWPYLRPALWRATALIFLLCFISFAIILTLGGGIWANNLETAIYQALRLEFAPAKAAWLSLLQVTLCSLFAALILRFAKPTHNSDNDMGLGDTSLPPRVCCQRPDAPLWRTRITDTIAIIIAGLLIIPVLMAIIMAILSPRAVSFLLSPSFFKALGGSLTIAPLAACLAVACAYSMGSAARHAKLRLRWRHASMLFELPALFILLMPPLTLSAGLFLLFHNYGIATYNSTTTAYILVVSINALICLPFALYILAPPLHRIAAEQDRLAFSVGLSGWRRWRLLERPLLRGNLGFALGVSAALSLGDMSAIALFGSQDFTTLPLLLYRLLGSYRMLEAGGVGFALWLLVFLLFFVSGWLFRRRHA